MQKTILVYRSSCFFRILIVTHKDITASITNLSVWVFWLLFYNFHFCSGDGCAGLPQKIFVSLQELLVCHRLWTRTFTHTVAIDQRQAESHEVLSDVRGKRGSSVD